MAVESIELVSGGKIELPLVKLSSGVVIRFFDPYDMKNAKEVLRACDDALKKILRSFKATTLVVPATKPIPIAWSLAFETGLDLVVIKKEVKPYHEDPVFFDAKSITSEGTNKFFVERKELESIRGKNIVFFDDVYSTGATYRACLDFLWKNGALSVRSLFVLHEGDGQLPHSAVACGKIKVDLS